MPMLPKKKVGLISCSGEELPEGTLSRAAALRVLERLRPNETVTLCLPLFLAGDDKERAFARFYPTIAIDGCEKQCAARATAKYSATPAVSLVIPDLLAAHNLDAPHNRRRLDAVGEQAASAVAEEIAFQVDEILGLASKAADEPEAVKSEPATASCSCGSGIPVMRLNIAGKNTEVVALPLLFEQFRDEDKPMEDLFAAVKIYNSIPVALEADYHKAILTAYRAFLESSAKNTEGARRL